MLLLGSTSEYSCNSFLRKRSRPSLFGPQHTGMHVCIEIKIVWIFNSVRVLGCCHIFSQCADDSTPWISSPRLIALETEIDTLLLQIDTAPDDRKLLFSRRLKLKENQANTLREAEVRLLQEEARLLRSEELENKILDENEERLLQEQSQRCRIFRDQGKIGNLFVSLAKMRL